MNYKEIMLTEVKKTPYKAVSLSSGRLVYFGSDETMKHGIADGEYREYNQTTDAHLEKPKKASGSDSGAPKHPAQPTTAPVQQSAPQAASEPAQPAQPSAMDAAYDSLPPEDRAMIHTVSKRTATFWSEKLRVLAGTMPAGQEANQEKGLKEDPKVGHKREFLKLMDTFAGATKLSDQVNSVTKMMESGYIAFDADEKSTKIYLETKVLGMDQEFLTRSKTKASKEMMGMIYAIAKVKEKEMQAPLPRYDRSHFGKKADKSGQHHEYGVAHYLQQFRDNKSKRGNKQDKLLDTAYDLIRGEFAELSGNDFKQDKFNEETAYAIRDYFVPEGARLTDVRVVSKTTRFKDPLDPTDMVITYEHNGQRTKVNISLKNLVGPDSITLRSLGTDSWGRMIGGKAGQVISQYHKQNLEPPELDGDDRGDAWEDDSGEWDSPDITELDEFEDEEPDMSNPQIAEKVQFTRFVANQMAKLQYTEEGQQQLQNMWKDMHGCYKNVAMIITNNISGQTNLAGPDDYCGPGKLKIGYHGRRITVRMAEAENKHSYLEFNYRSRINKKSGEKTGQLQILRKFGGGKKINKAK